jgi:hypothetical protein
MKIVRNVMLLVVVVLAMNTVVSAQMPTVLDVLKKMEAIEFVESDGTLKMSFTLQRKDQGVKPMEAVFYRRDKDDAFLMVITAPESDKGNGYLRTGDNMWMYRRNSRTYQKMSRYQNIIGTLNAVDFEKRKYSELYAPFVDANGKELISEDTLGQAKIPVYRIEVKVVAKDLPFPRMVYYVNKDTFLTMKSEGYSESGVLMVSAYTPKYHEINGKFITAKVMSVDEFEKGNKTLVDLSGVSLQPIDDTVFTKAYLESLSK